MVEINKGPYTRALDKMSDSPNSSGTSKLRAVIYARVSTQEQAQKRTSIPDQIEIGHKTVEHKNWEFIGEYKDEGVSGHLVEERHGLQSMLRDARAHKFDLIVVKDYDRFARNKDSAAIIRHELKELGIQTFSVNTPVDPKLPGEYDPDDDDLSTIVETISDMRSDLERKQIARRMKMGKLSRAKLGIIPNKVPYGYQIIRTLETTKIKRTITVNEEEAARVRFIFDRYVRGEGKRKIALEMNKKGWRSAKGSYWSSESIRYILHNPTYTGKVWWGWRHADYKKTKEWRRRGKLGYIGSGTHQAIIDEKLFNLAQEVHSGRARSGCGATQRSRGVLTGIAKCIRCRSGVGYSKRYHSRSKTNPNWRDTITYEYICTGYKYKGICSPRVMSADKLESAVLDYIKNLYAHPKIQDQVVHQGNSSEEIERENEIARLRREVELEGTKIDRQTLAYERGITPIEEYQANVERIRDDAKRNRMEVDRLLSHSSIAAQHTAVVQKLTASMKDFDSFWKALELDEKKLILRSIIRQIRAGNGRVEVDFIL